MKARLFLRISVAGLALTACSRTCGQPRTELFAVGASSTVAAPSPCHIEGDALAPTKDGERTQQGKGIDFDAVNVGQARIKCDADSESVTIDVREAVRIEFIPTGPGKVGQSVPQACLAAFDRSGNKLDIGRFTTGIKFDWSDNDLHRKVDHGMGWLGPPDTKCVPDMTTLNAGPLKITGEWRGMTASTTIQILP